MKPIDADHPITSADVGRKAVRRDGQVVTIQAYDRSADAFRPVCALRTPYASSGHIDWQHSESPFDLVQWADAPATSPHTVKLTIRVPLDQVSSVASEFEVVALP